MKKSQLARIEKLEETLKASFQQTVWVDLVDNRVRIDIGTKRGQEITFDTVRDCIEWAENQIAQFEKITGLAHISDISQTFVEGMPREMFNRIYENAPYRSVTVNLAKMGSFNKLISSAAYVLWWHSVSRSEAFRKEVLERLEALSQSLEEEEEDML